jgi:hypothetical protein
MSSRLCILAVAGCLVGGALVARAKVFHGRSEALELAFPGAERVESRTFVLDDSQAEAAEALARTPLESRLVTLYTGYEGERVVGYALIDLHTVRTRPEAFMVVLSREGAVQGLRMLAFHEPLEYLPAQGWLARFEGRTLDDDLRLGGGIDGIAGATLTSRAVTGGVRRALALHQLLVRDPRATKAD